MRRVCVTVCFCVALLVRPAPAQESAYEAEVVDDVVTVRSGPAQEYYATGTLKRGAKVRVLRHDYGGWYAIEPPRGSFSWIDARHIREQGGGAGTITANNVVVRIGGVDDDRRDILAGVQCQLGDKVRLLGREVSERHGAAYKVAPIKGEERWVSGRALTTIGQHDKDLGPDESALPVENAADSAWTGAQPILQAAGERQDDAQTGSSPEAGGASIADTALTGKTSKQAEAEATARPQETPTTVRKPTVNSTPPADPEPAQVPPDPATALLEDAHRRLAETVAGEVATWDLRISHALYRRALLQANTHPVRAAARLGLDRVARFEAIKANYDAFQRAKQRAQSAASPQPPVGGRQPDMPHANAAPVVVQAAAAGTATRHTREVNSENPTSAVQQTPGASLQAPPQRLTTSFAPRDRQPRAGHENVAPLPRYAGQPQTSTVDVHRSNSSAQPPLAQRRSSHLVEIAGWRNASQPQPTAPQQPAIGAPRQRPEVDRVPAGGRQEGQVAQQPAAPAVPAAHQQPGTLKGPAPRFDGVGILQRTAVQGVHAPQYKLVDPTGRVRFYVSPALGVSLRPHLHQSVAVVGQVTFRSDLRTRHITVHQVYALGRDDASQATSP